MSWNAVANYVMPSLQILLMHDVLSSSVGMESSGTVHSLRSTLDRERFSAIFGQD